MRRDHNIETWMEIKGASGNKFWRIWLVAVGSKGIYFLVLEYFTPFCESVLYREFTSSFFIICFKIIYPSKPRCAKQPLSNIFMVLCLLPISASGLAYLILLYSVTIIISKVSNYELPHCAIFCLRPTTSLLVLNILLTSVLSHSWVITCFL
jgi:hypothetical protein